MFLAHHGLASEAALHGSNRSTQGYPFHDPSHSSESCHSPKDPIGPRRTVYNSTSVMATCGPCRTPAGVFQKAPVSHRLPPVSTVPDSTNTYSFAGWVWTGMMVPELSRTRWIDPPAIG